MSVLKPLAERGIEAWSRGEAQLFLSIVDRYGRAMGSMGRDAGVSIVTPEIEAVIRRAAEGGGAAKPSGAGGGDVVVMWSEHEALGPQIAAETGLELLDVRIDPRGMSRRG
jgi:phosphomevalonate kinase